MYKPDLVVLPILIEKNNEGKKEIKLLSANDLMQEGYLNASRWFTNVENTWKLLKTEKNEKISSEDYMNWQNKLTEQNLKASYLVLYNSSAKDANATIIKRKDIKTEFFVESVTYVFYTNNLKEAFYLTSIFNSSIPNELMKNFQARGL